MRGIAAANKALISTVNAILESDQPMTLRQLHYQIFRYRRLGSVTDEVYTRCLSAVNIARMAIANEPAIA
jgi:hypothetical protein